ncbi:polysaccharide deacetylase family protein [Hamadaea tsunoensis]|uniref:polysaccharide deacetylase family protein n=1 Tax=Hamadaea tsunoensis TaxID=53368 RepID=UPI000414E332|nr:polysaccharide deacetylase family protein [Hamadaea tsunoensis]
MTAALVALAALALLGGAAYFLLMSPFSQVFGAYPYRARTRDRVVALTFDDGPNEPYTSEILDYLEQQRIRATFFQVGRCVERHPDTARRIAAAGHTVGNHSLTHRFDTYLKPRAFEAEVAVTQEILTRTIGRTPALARSPWLWRRPGVLRMFRRHDLNPVAGEFCHALEVFQPSGTRLARRAVAKTKPGSILIFHDGFDGHGGDRSQTVRAVRLTVEALSAQGYRFVTVDELLGVPAWREA